MSSKKMHTYIDSNLIDMVAIETWFRSRTWPSHGPQYTMKSLRREIGEHREGEPVSKSITESLWILREFGLWVTPELSAIIDKRHEPSRRYPK